MSEPFKLEIQTPAKTSLLEHILCAAVQIVGFVFIISFDSDLAVGLSLLMWGRNLANRINERNNL